MASEASLWPIWLFVRAYEAKTDPTEAILMTIFLEENKESIMNPPFTARTVLDDT